MLPGEGCSTARTKTRQPFVASLAPFGYALLEKDRRAIETDGRAGKPGVWGGKVLGSVMASFVMKKMGAEPSEAPLQHYGSFPTGRINVLTSVQSRYLHSLTTPF
jgi:predicted alpha/beta-hydrolase family hydrolase